MDIETAREYCLAKKAVTECLPFDEYSLVMKVMDKMFVLIDGDADDKLIKSLIDHAYEEVLKKFTKKMRTEYDALP